MIYRVLTHAGLPVAAMLALSASGAWAAPLPSDLAVTGEISFDTTNSFASDADSNGSFSTTVGGADGTTSYTDGSPDAPNPRSATFTHLGDGFALDGVGNAAGADSAMLAGMDFLLTLLNTSPVATYTVHLEMVFDHRVDSDGSDAYADSEFTIGEGGTEVAFTDITSDTFFGDVSGGADLGTFGEEVTDVGMRVLTAILTPGASVEYDGAWTGEAESFEPDSSSLLDFSGSFRITSVESDQPPPGVIPLPASLPLALGGLALLAGIALRRGR